MYYFIYFLTSSNILIKVCGFGLSVCQDSGCLSFVLVVISANIFGFSRNLIYFTYLIGVANCSTLHTTKIFQQSLPYVIIESSWFNSLAISLKKKQWYPACNSFSLPPSPDISGQLYHRLFLVIMGCVTFIIRLLGHSK